MPCICANKDIINNRMYKVTQCHDVLIFADLGMKTGTCHQILMLPLNYYRMNR